MNEIELLQNWRQNILNDVQQKLDQLNKAISSTTNVQNDELKKVQEELNNLRAQCKY